jgi:uracil phosphoribosyltransferase
MELIVADHPLVTTKLTRLRVTETPSPVFRQLVDELVTLLSYEATRTVRTTEWAITTPVAPTIGVRLADPRPLIVPILRAGLGMLDGITRLIPTAEVGFLGMVRDEETLEPFTYAERLPADIVGRQAFVLDPMLATGGSLTAAIEFLAKRGASEITAICLLAAPEGVERCRQLADSLGLNLTLVIAGLDEKLNEKGYIVPGLGDAGDRLYGLVG